MRHGTARTTFLIGALLSLPGASYLAALDRLSKLNYSTTVTVIIVVCFNLVMLSVLEIPQIAFRVAPTRTPQAIEDGKAWAKTHGRELRRPGGLVVIAKACWRSKGSWAWRCDRGSPRSEQLVLAAEHVAHGSVREDLADRARQQVGAREHAHVVRSPSRQRDRVGDDDLLKPGPRQVLPRSA